MGRGSHFDMHHTIVTVPGYTGSGPGHRQTLWEREHPDWVRVEQRDRDRPERLLDALELSR